MNKCIKKKHFKDGVVNCPFMKCPDEGGCDLSMSGNNMLPLMLISITLMKVLPTLTRYKDSAEKSF